MKTEKEKSRQLVIYYNREKTIYRVITPGDKFEGSWENLLMGITNGVGYYSWETR